MLKPWLIDEGQKTAEIDLPDIYIRNCAVYVFKVKNLNNDITYGKKCIGYKMNPESAVDINDMLDFEFAEYFFKKNNKWIKAAIVGCGRHGLRYYEASKTVEGLKIGALVDKNQKTCEGITSSHFYIDLEKMLVDYKPNLLIIATNGPSHFEIAKKAIDFGVEMLIISKPVTTSYGDALKLDKLIKKKGVRVAVDHGLRHDATYNWIKKNLVSNNWGDVFQVTIERSGIGLGWFGNSFI